ncbi:MAG: diguanylate cyclase, partial [Cyanobacteria bacterium P01_D01_bin.123]
VRTFFLKISSLFPIPYSLFWWKCLLIMIENKGRIIVVDDTPANLHLLSNLLEERDYEVRAFPSAKLALMGMKNFLPELILLDITMPQMNGYEMCEYLKENEKWRDIPVIFISALNEIFDKVKAFQTGGADYITKPFQVEEVIARVRHQLELKSTKIRLNQLNYELEQRVEKRTQQLQTVNQQLQASEARLENILNALDDAIWSATVEPFQIRYLNPAAEVIFQRPRQEFLSDDRLWLEVTHPEDRAELITAIQSVSSRKSLDLEYRILQPDGSVRWIRNRANLTNSGNATSVQIEGIISDISERKEVEQKLIYNALHDALTDLPNRTLFMERLEHALKRKQRRPKYALAVLFVDLDRFKMVNDSFGHAAGDLLLIEVANRLRSCLRQADTVARWGGDEFTVIIDEITDIEHVQDCIDRILSELNMPIKINENIVSTGASIGVVIVDNTYTSASDILRDADIAMYRAKTNPESSYELHA